MSCLNSSSKLPHNFLCLSCFSITFFVLPVNSVTLLAAAKTRLTVAVEPYAPQSSFPSIPCYTRYQIYIRIDEIHPPSDTLIFHGIKYCPSSSAHPLRQGLRCRHLHLQCFVCEAVLLVHHTMLFQFSDLSYPVLHK